MAVRLIMIENAPNDLKCVNSIMQLGRRGNRRNAPSTNSRCSSTRRIRG